jgi:hypothetical protein
MSRARNCAYGSSGPLAMCVGPSSARSIAVRTRASDAKSVSNPSTVLAIQRFPATASPLGREREAIQLAPFCLQPQVSAISSRDGAS